MDKISLMSDFLKAMEKLIEERFPSICVIYVKELYWSWSSKRYIGGLCIEIEGKRTKFVCVCDNSYYSAARWHDFDITNPEFNPEIIIDFIKSQMGVPGGETARHDRADRKHK